MKKYKLGEKVWCQCTKDVQQVVIKGSYTADDGVNVYVVVYGGNMYGRQENELFKSEQEAKNALTKEDYEILRSLCLDCKKREIGCEIKKEAENMQSKAIVVKCSGYYRG